MAKRSAEEITKQLRSWCQADKLCVDAAFELDRLRSALAEAKRERDEARRRLGGGCDANDGGDHVVIREKRYAFCAKCGESLRGIRYCHELRAALAQRDAGEDG